MSAHESTPNAIVQTHYYRPATLVRCVAPAKCSARSIWRPPTLFFQMCSEFLLEPLSLKPLEGLTGGAIARNLAGDAYRERPNRFIASYLGIPELR